MSRFLVGIAIVLLILTLSAAAAQEPTPPNGALYELVEVADGFERPLFVTGAGDGTGRLFIMEQGGNIYVSVEGVTQNAPFLDARALVSRDANERGLLGLAFHPQFAENGIFFINYTDLSGDTVVARYRVSADDPNRADAASAEIILRIDQPYPNHNGGGIAFGPDGYLYIGTGDGGSAGDPLGAGQDPSTLLGKMLRIDIDNGAPYAIPADNPFVNDASFAPEIWAWGLRNPWRFSFDRETGDLYIADVGQNQYEEVNFQPASSEGGENYGWNIKEGKSRYSGQPVPQGLTDPFFDYRHSSGCSVTGGYVYRGAALPQLNGVYFFGDYCSGLIWASYRDATGEWQTEVFMDSRLAISSFGEDDDGELYVVNHGGSVLKLVARSA